MLHDKIVKWLKDYIDESKLDCFVVGISGGIDSALVSTLCSMTGIKTITLSLPIHQSRSQLSRAESHTKWLKERYSNVSSFEYELTETFEKFKSLFNIDNDLALANSRSRLRMTTLYHVSSIYNGLVVGTGNKVEDFGIGFFTKYGDGGVDISPIADLMKSEVRQMSKELGIIDEIISAKPTDGLWNDDRDDEQQIGATYDELEWAMLFDDDENYLSLRQKEVLEIYSKFHNKNKHKMVSIPIFKINKI